MKLSMNKILKSALSVCATCLILSGCVRWNWKPDPYVGDSKTQSLINAEGAAIICTEERFNEMTCFTPEDIASLKAEIEKLKEDIKALEAEASST